MNSPIHINKCPNADAAVTKASQDLAAALQQALAENTDILLLLSGGGNLVVAQNTQGLINQSRITTYVLDERFSRDPAQNNSLQLQAAGIEVELTVPAATESVEEFAARFNGEITTWLLEHPQGKIICTWGMGPDGHVAGISPMPDEADRYQETFYQTTQLVVGYEGNLQPPTRVTVTPTFICQKIDILLGLVTGSSKQDAWQKFLNSASEEYQLPVMLLKKVRGKIVVATDLEQELRTPIV